MFLNQRNKYLPKLFCRMLIISFLFGMVEVNAQENPKIRPYTIKSTYNKLKKDYPFIKPIERIENDQITAKQNITYRKTNGRKLKADVYTPKQKGVFPGVLLIHGGGWASGSKDNLQPMAQRLAEAGFVAVVANYTLSEVDTFPAAVQDLKHALVWMRENGLKFGLNPKEIAVLGASAGGQLATLLGTNVEFGNSKDKQEGNGSEVQAVINIDGIVSFVHPEAEEGEIAALWLGGTKRENFKNWKRASPLEYVDKDFSPILFINSAQPRFHAGRDDMLSALKDLEIYTEVCTIPDTPHSFWLMQPWFDTTLKYTINFLNNIFKS